jgi:hypothetical protein
MHARRRMVVSVQANGAPWVKARFGRHPARPLDVGITTTTLATAFFKASRPSVARPPSDVNFTTCHRANGARGPMGSHTRRPRAWTVDARTHDALSHSANMTPRKRREWARVFLSARRHGLGGLKLILFSVECARELGSGVPIFLAVRVVARLALTRRRGRRVRPAWRLPPVWAARAVGALAVGIALWGIFTLSDSPAPRAETEVEDTEVPEWLLTGQGDAGVVAKKMPSKRMRGQRAPPCEAPNVSLNDACWARLEQLPPCGDFYEQDGRCYVPVAASPRPPTSADP